MSSPVMEKLYESANAGDVNAMVECGKHLLSGTDCDIDEKSAVAWFQKAAELGNGEAARQLGMCYAYGTGVAKDDKASTEYFRKGAEAGDAESMYKLFQNLSIGVGCTANLDEADSWLAKAKDLGYEKAVETWKSFSDSRMLGATIREDAKSFTREETGLLDADLRAGSLEKLAPSLSFDLRRLAITEAKDTEITKEGVEFHYHRSSPTVVVVIYAIVGLLSGYLLERAFWDQKPAADRLTNLPGDGRLIIALLLISGLIVGVLVGLLMMFLSKRIPLGLLKYLPAVAVPLALLTVAPFLMTVVTLIGKVLYAVIVLAVGALGLMCVCGSS